MEFLAALSIIAVLNGICLAGTPPHIVLVVADDLGWNDVGWHNPEMITPNLDKLANSGVILNSSYVQPGCTPSRNCIMSGYYPYHTGLQVGIIEAKQAKGLPLNLTTLPQKLKQQGYATHIIGKWHLGFCKWEFTPTYRGFDTFYGFYNGREDYYTHSSGETQGLDFRLNEEVVRNEEGKYSTFLFRDRALDVIKSHDKSKPMFLYMPFQAPHLPLEVPKKYENMYANVTDENRRIYSGMITAMDDAIGSVVSALEKGGFMDNLLFIFTTDNGGMSLGPGSNLPLRGGKGTLWEGGTRGAAFAYSKNLFSKTGYVNPEMIHAVDWYPTLIQAAGGSVEESIDGVSQWRTLVDGSPSRRTEFVYNLGEESGAIRSRNCFMSGYYPYHTGLQVGVIEAKQAKGLPLNLTTLPQKLKQQGYATHIIGKWHLGFCKWEFTPTYRGFDTFYGFYNGLEDYYTHSSGQPEGLDFRLNEEVVRNEDGKYSTFLFRDRALDVIKSHDKSKPMFLYMPFQAPHTPLEVPKKYENMYANVTDENRRIYSGMITAMDDAIGSVVSALEKGGFMDNLLFIFTTDNGGMTMRAASNLPLRGGKGTLWEGGTRGAAFAYSKNLFSKTGYVNPEMIHAVDWYPTLIQAAGGSVEDSIDGVSQWRTLVDGSPSSRTEFVYNLGEESGAIRHKKYKLIHQGRPPGGRIHHKRQERRYQLFDLDNDPNEETDISLELPEVVEKMRARMEGLRKSMVTLQSPENVPAADPSNYGGVWTPGWC